MTPFETMQALTEFWGKSGQAFANAQQTMFQDMTERMSKAMSGDGAAAMPNMLPNVQGFDEAQQAFARSWSYGGGAFVEPDQAPRGQRRPGGPARGRHADQDLRPARLVLGDERDGRGAGPHGRGPAPRRPLERRAQVRRRVHGLGGLAPPQPGAPDGHARRLDAGDGRLRQAPQRPRRPGRAAARLLARAAGALDRHRQRDAPGAAALGGLPQAPARPAQGLDRPPARAARGGRVLQRDVRLPDPGGARRRAQDRHRAAARAARHETPRAVGPGRRRASSRKRKTKST